MSSAMVLDPAPGPAPASEATPTSPVGLQNADSRDDGGCDIGKQDIHDEALKYPVLCKQNIVGSLTGVLHCGSQGTLKTKPSKEIINHTRAAYRRVADPAFFRMYLEETKKRIFEGKASSETYMEEVTVIATSNLDTQTKTVKVVERVFAEIWSKGHQILGNVGIPTKGGAPRTFLEVLYSLPDSAVDIENRTDRVVGFIFREIWRQVQDKQEADPRTWPQPEAIMVSKEEFQAEWEAKLKLLDQRFKMLDESEKNVDWEAQLKLLKRRIVILDMETENEKKKGDKIMRKNVNMLIFETSQFMASFENKKKKKNSYAVPLLAYVVFWIVL